MRNQIWIPACVVLVVCLALVLAKLFKQVPPTASEIQATAINQPERPQPSAQSETTLSPGNPKQASLAAQMAGLSPAEASNVLVQRELAIWQAPIEFYGKVVDENSNPVEGASVAFGWMELPTDDGSRTATTNSDARGLFSLHGARGPSLSVSVSKDGYYMPHHGQWGFSYAPDNDTYSPDIANPVIFKLRKKGQGAELITSQNGISTQVGVRVPTDGSPVKVDLLKKGPDPSGQLEISQVKPPWNEATAWSFRVSIPDGGLVENQDDFQFQAPETGYQPSVQYDFSKNDAGWTTQVTKQFYIAFGNPRKYGWLRFESNLGQQTVFLTYAINPDGSQNLEPAQ